ncbi:prepilin-type N-terminal cleavage/methylation domain-containing protein [Curtobacterium sp. MCPF17_031]|uniref:prepilin-type N-terminal cleavage/methylation domain-containing protein n=1 Tax=Curtobacterium sp. MCPF17_031 TaxID=2175653 RepID=UPI0015E8E684|nr:prepilin-type N-terminal cleavage/methylation domain-containing protein [Curtobacterium sp. MCPF17_031]
MNSWIRQVYARARSDQRGLTLVELLVAMTLSLIVLTVAGSFLISSQRASNTASSVSANTRTAANAMNAVGRLLRAATDNPVPTGDDSQFAFQYASANSIRFFAYVNLESTLSQAVEVQITLDPARKTITETKWSGVAVAGNSSYFSFPLGSGPTLTAVPTSKRTLANSVVNGAMFVFKDGAGNVLGSPGAAIAASDLPNIRTVTVTATVGRAASDPSAVTLVNSASMPNIVMGAP